MHLGPNARKTNPEECKEQSNLVSRVFFSLAFVVALIYTNTRHGAGRSDYLPAEACLEDKTFVWTESLNHFFLSNLAARDWVIMFNSFWIDATLCGLLFLFSADKLPSLTFAIALMIIAFVKTFI